MGAPNLLQATETSTATSATSAAGPMSFTTTVKQLRGSITTLARIADKRSSLPALAHVAIRVSWASVTLTATDLNVYAAIDAPAWQIHAPGNMAVKAKALADALKTFPDGDVTLSKVDALGIELRAASGAVRKLDAVTADNYMPKFPPILVEDDLKLTPVDAEGLHSLLDRVSHAQCKDETRFHMCGVCLDIAGANARAVATDGHRLATVTGYLGTSDLRLPGVIVPTKGVTEIVRLLSKARGNALVGESGVFVVVRHGNTTLAIKRVDATFPPWEQVMPKGKFSSVTVNRKDLIATLKRAKPICDRSRGVALTLDTDGYLSVEASHPDNGSLREQLVAEVDGDGGTIGVNATYLLDALDAIPFEVATIVLSGNASKAKWSEGHREYQLAPMAVKGEDPDDTFVIMPMRL